MSHACLRARRLAAAIPFVLVLLLVPSSSFAADLQATPSNLSSVFGSAQGGDVIHLAAGSYGSFSGGKKASMVTLQADPGVSASIAPDLGSASNVRFKNLTLPSVYIGPGSSYIELVGNKVTGATLIDTANSDMHVLLDGNSHDNINVCSSCYEGRITVKGNNNSAPNGVQITNSHFTGGDADGVQITGYAYGTKIGPNNTFINLDMVDSVHTDAIQLYHSHNTLITGNFLYSNETGIMAPDGADHETITNNVITTNGYPWPIVLGSDNGTVVQHNTFPDGACSWSMRCGTVRVYDGNASVASKNTLVRDNIVGALDVSGSGVVEDHNLVATGTAPGAADIKGQPTFQGGSSPTTYSGFLLTGTSLGKSNASDGTDRGITGTGATPPPPPPPPPPAAPATPTITAGPSGSTTSTSASFSFTTDDSAATFSCSLDGAAYASCSSPKAYSSLATGGHTFSVKATNSTGTSAAATRSWTVTAPPPSDTTPPDTTITSGPSGTTRDNTPTYAFTSTEAGTFACRVDSGAWSACTSPWTTAALSDGAHTVAVRATDAAGNTDASPATRSLTVDTTAPTTTITSAPAAATTSTSAAVAFSANDAGATFECAFDGGPFAACTSPWTRSGLALGQHTLRVRATDAAGNVESSPKSATWLVAATPVVDPPPAPAPPVTTAAATTPAEPAATADAPAAPATAAATTPSAPRLTLVDPMPGTALPTAAVLTATAGGGRQISRVEFWLDGRRVARLLKAPYRARLTAARRIGYGAHTVTARAFDSAGTASSVAVTVVRRRGASPRAARVTGWSVASSAAPGGTELVTTGPSARRLRVALSGCGDRSGRVARTVVVHASAAGTRTVVPAAGLCVLGVKPA